MTQIRAVEAVQEADVLRSNVYKLLARGLSAPADDAYLTALRDLEGDGTEFGRALATLREAAQAAEPGRAAEEYQDLFIGLGRGELVPYGSYYLTGFLHEKPLARLRGDMARLGIERAEGVSEPEDHAGALLEMMAGLILGEFADPAPISVQSEFFEKHIASWMPHFFRDLEEADSAKLLQPIGTIGRLFIEIEAAAFEM